jgi:hypothetical protein
LHSSEKNFQFKVQYAVLPALFVTEAKLKKEEVKTEMTASTKEMTASTKKMTRKCKRRLPLFPLLTLMCSTGAQALEKNNAAGCKRAFELGVKTAQGLVVFKSGAVDVGCLALKVPFDAAIIGLEDLRNPFEDQKPLDVCFRIGLETKLLEALKESNPNCK